MPRPGGRRVQEKSKDFFGSTKRLILNLKPWKYMMILALSLAMISSILSLIAPNQLSTFTDTIREGITPNTNQLKELSARISTNLSQEKIGSKIALIGTVDSIGEEEVQKTLEIMKELPNAEEEQALGYLLQLPDSVLLYLLEDIEIDKTIISVSDQVAMLRLFSRMGGETGTEKALELLDQLPDSVYSLIKPSIDMTKIKHIAIFMGTIYILSSLFGYIESYSMTTVSNHFAKNLRTRISNKINILPLKYFDTHETGDVLSRVTNDVDTIAQNLNNSLATLVSCVTLFLGSILMMFITNWVMAITAILSSLIGFSLMFFLLGKSQKYFAASQEALGDINGYIEEIYSGHNVVKAYNGS